MSAPAVGALVAALLFAGVPGYATAQDASSGTPDTETIAERVRERVLRKLEELEAEQAAAGPGGSVVRFKLWTGCRRMNLVISASSMSIPGLTPESLRNLVETRLRAARLYNPSPVTERHTGTLHIIVEKVAGAGFIIFEMEFWKWLYDHASFNTYLATAWDYISYWPETTDANTARNTVSQSLDWFLVEYLGVNEPACGGP